MIKGALKSKEYPFNDFNFDRLDVLLKDEKKVLSLFELLVLLGANLKSKVYEEKYNKRINIIKSISEQIKKEDLYVVSFSINNLKFEKLVENYELPLTLNFISSKKENSTFTLQKKQEDIVFDNVSLESEDGLKIINKNDLTAFLKEKEKEISISIKNLE